MKIRRTRAIMISAYLSAMLSSSVAPVRSDVALAGAVDSTAARKALQSAIAELNVGGWSPSVTAPANVATPQAIPAAVAPLQASDPIISQEMMTRLIRRASAAKVDAPIDPRICAIFVLPEGTCHAAKQIVHEGQDGKRYFVMPLKEGSKDIIVAFKSPSGDVIDSYLTDKSGNLRAVATSGRNGDNVRLIPNEQGAEKYKAHMQFLAKLAEKLPPTGTTVAGNS